jgi:hypothetical protein
MENRTPHETDLHSNDFVRFWHETGRPFWDRWGTHISVVLIVLCGGYALYQYRTYSHMETNEQAWTDVANSSSPDAYYKVAADHRSSRPAVAASAWLSGADMSLEEARKAAKNPVTDAATGGDVVKAATADDHLSKAYTGYDAVAKMANIDPVYRLNAKLGLAAVSEGKLDWEQAAKLYEAVVADAGDAYPMLKARAQARLDLLPRLKKPVVFNDTPKLPFPLNTDTLPDGATGNGLELMPFDSLMEDEAAEDLIPVKPLEMEAPTPADDAATDSEAVDTAPPTE